MKTQDWRVACAPHHNHQDTPSYEVGTQIWFDQYLKGSFQVPFTPKLNLTLPNGKSPIVNLEVDESQEVDSIDVFYTQQGQMDDEKDSSTNTKNRFWHYAQVSKHKKQWATELPLFSVEKPLWVYANVRYKLEKPIVGAGYYYGVYETSLEDKVVQLKVQLQQKRIVVVYSELHESVNIVSADQFSG